MLTSVEKIGQATDNFAAFSYEDTGHCATLVDDFYEVQVGGVYWVDWLRISLGKGASSVGRDRSAVSCGCRSHPGRLAWHADWLF